MTLLLPVAAMLLPGCWTPPTADIQPLGPSRLIQAGVVVKSVIRLAIVQSVDPETQTIVMQVPGTPGAHAYRADLKVPGLDRLPVGAKVRAIVSEELTVYVSRDGRLPGADGVLAETAPQAKVLSIDPSYRLLTLQHRDGETQTFKVEPEVQLERMQAGDDVMIRAPEVVSLSIRKQ
jgi:hypothetical protein